MLSLLKRLLLYVYILATKFKQRNVVVSQLKRWCRQIRDVTYDKPGLPDAIDDIHGIPDGWSEFQCFTAFDKDGTCIHLYQSNSGDDKKELYLKSPSIGTLKYSETHSDDSTDGTYVTKKKRLIIEVVDPMKKWKLSFRGHIRMITSNAERKMVFVRLHLYWNSTGDPYDFWLDTPAWLVAGTCANLSLSDALSLLRSKSIWFQQWGELQGSVTIEDVDFRIRLSACRERRFVNETAYETNIDVVRTQHCEIDHIIHRYSYKIIKFRSGRLLKFGHVLFPSMESYHILKLKDETSDDKCTIRVCGKDLRVSETISKCVIKNDNMDMLYNKFTIDDRTATGVELLMRIRVPRVHAHREEQNIDSHHVSTDNENVLLLDVSDFRCEDKNLVGGKAANLSYLMSLGYNIPAAFCITTKAFWATVENNSDLVDAIENIKRTIQERRTESLKSACDKAVQCLKETNIMADTIKGIEKKVKDMLPNKGVAVRSSAKGEDGEVLSAAGQLETILGVRSLDNVIEAIKTCWSSYLSFQSVEYRRQNGQVIVDGMSVVVQEMVHSEVSGVMMTNDPLTGREDRILINASYHLGESVVSGQTEPDTIVVGVDEYGEFTILKEIVGAKSKQVDLLSSGGTYIKETSVQEGICLSKEMVYSLCKLGKSIERHFQFEQDIEWAVFNNTVYILQSRHITSIEGETDEDLFHEFDTPKLSESDLITTCNIQEIMPGATTPLTRSYFVPAIDEAFYYVNIFSNGGSARVYHFSSFVVSYGNSCFINRSPVYIMALNDSEGLKAKVSTDIDFLGEECKEVTVDQIRKFKGTPFTTGWERIKAYPMKILFVDSKLDRDIRKWENQMYSYTIGNESDDARLHYLAIDKDRINLFYIWMLYCHLLTNPYIIMVKAILMGSSFHFNRENMEDLSNLLLKCGTVSAEVPKAITTLAKAIKSNGLADEFMDLPDEKCISLLNKTKSLRCLFREFLMKHGHRCIREAELFEKSWDQDPTQLIQSLKSILKNGFVEHQYDPDDESAIEEVISNLKTTLTPSNLLLIRKYMKKTLTKVLDRERGKSLVIKIVHAFKKAYWSLAERMVSEGRIPEEELLFFMTHREIGELIDTRSPTLIRKAKRRMKIYPMQKAVRYERISFGIPKPMTESTKSSREQSLFAEMEGTPNGKGQAMGRACVVKSQEDVSLIKKGDILICVYTDIGWSPYFPLIGGLVTELGGVLSHGAVIARECGIPCVVNVANATKLLRTGDTVRINGSRGTVEKMATN